jgi:hypothetical protein
MPDEDGPASEKWDCSDLSDTSVLPLGVCIGIVTGIFVLELKDIAASV